MDVLRSVLFLVFLLCIPLASLGLSDTFECSQVVVDSIAPNNPDFSDNACILIADFEVPDCEIPPPSPFEPDAPIVMCPAAPIVPTVVVDGSQTIYNDIVYALQHCPYDPVLIEFIGTIYVTNTSFIYNQTKDLIIRGISQTTFVPGQNITEIQPVFNATTNTTEMEEVIVGVEPDSFITLQSTIVGFKDLQVIHQNVSVTTENFVMEGCHTESGVFLTLACPERCDADNTNYCPGAWYPRAMNVTTNGLCTNTGAYFNGTQRISFQENVNDNFGKYNGATTEDTEWFRFNDVTVEAWVNPAAGGQTSYAGIVGNYRYGNAKKSRAGYGLFYSPTQNNLVHFRVAGPDYQFVECTQVIPPTAWTHLAGTYSGSTGQLSMYINGFLVCNATGPVRPPYYGTNAFRTMAVGSMWYDVDNGGSDNDRGNYFKGVIDEVRVWNVSRTSAQIQFGYDQQLPGTVTGLVASLRFDRGANFLVNTAQGNTPGLPTPKELAQNNFNDHVAAVDDCFCVTPDANNEGNCVPTQGSVQVIPGSVTMIDSNDDPNDYEFVYSVVIQPNGPYGMLFIPAVYNTTGFIFNQTTNIIPGVYQNVSTSTFNATSNTTEVSTEECFVPGVIPSTLPPANQTYLANYTYFMPGWFFNGGQPPFSALNFIPGTFAPPTGGNSTTLPECYRTGDSIFTAGITDEDGNFTPFSPMSLQAMIVEMMGGACWNCNDYVDSCIIRELIVTPFIPPPVEVIIDAFGCAISEDDPVVHYLNTSARSPCAIIQLALTGLPTGFTQFTPTQAAMCNVGPHDPEPHYLNNSIRDPCFILRDLRNLAATNNTLNCTDGSVPYPAVYMPCLKNQNLTMFAMTVQNYAGEKAVCQHACEENVNLIVSESNFVTIPGSALWSSGLQNYDVHDNVFCPCGGTTEACVYLNANHITFGDFLIYNNRHCAVEDLLPQTCLYDLSPTLKCKDGTLQCLDVVATLQEDCQQVEVSPNVFLFDSDCAIYTPCTCSAQDQNVTLPDGTVVIVTQNTGDVEITVDFITPLVESLLDGNDTLTLSCSTSQVLQEFIFECEVNVTMEVIVGNITMNITVTELQNCSSFQNVTMGVIDALPCPCPRGFNASFTTNLTGSAAAQALGLYNQCEWDIPGGLPGEQCVDQVVWCPYEGGTLGSGEPPPVPPGYCDDGTVVLSCGICTPDGGGGFEYYYENVTSPCPAYCGNSSTSVFSAPCMCDDFSLTVTCQRDIQCYNPTPCNGSIVLCAYTGTLFFDGDTYTCFVDENATDCVGISYAASNPGPPPDGQMTLPCTTSYILPSPGPCSCTGTGEDPNSNITLTNNATACNTTADPNCVTPPTPVNTGDPTVQFQCQPSGQLSCRCDSIYASGLFNGTNHTLLLNSTAYWIDHVPTEGFWFQQNNVAQGLPYGWRYTRFEKQLIRNFPLQVQHFDSAWFILHESGRLGMSPFITGITYDWVQGYDWNWNFRYCNQLDPGPAQGVYDNECQQFRPSQNESCVVDSNFNMQQTPNFGTTRFDRITDALNTDDCRYIIVHRATNMYEERLTFERSHVWFFSYDGAGIVESGHWINVETNLTIRGFTFVHTGSNDYPLLQPTALASNNYDAAFRGDPGEAPMNIKIQNCILDGHNVNKAGAIIGLFGIGVEVSYNVVRNFVTRAVFVDSPNTLLRQNVFIQNQGRVFRTQRGTAYNIEENLAIDNTGIRAASNVEFFSMRAQGDLGTVSRTAINSIFFGNLSAEDFNAQFDTKKSLESIDFSTLGCNTGADPTFNCYIRGNRVVITDPDDAKDFETVCFRVIGGAIPIENIRDNVCRHAKIGMDFSYTTSISFVDRAQVFKQNALIRVQDSYEGSNQKQSADLTFRFPGSLQTLGCFFPNCWPNTTYPTITSNPRFDLTIVDNYGFDTMANLTDSSRWGYPLNLVLVTSERAILRREQFLFEKDLYAVGVEDPFCCKKPIIYGGMHQMGAYHTVLDNLEYRFEILVDDVDGDVGNQHFETPPDFLALDIRFLRSNFDGRGVFGNSPSINIAVIFMDPEEGNFVLDSGTIYNYFHYPLGTYRGMLESQRGAFPVLVLPDDSIYYTALAPTVRGFKVYFQPNNRMEPSRFVKNTPKNPFKFINSVAVITGTNFTDLDGSVLDISTPGNWYISDNRIIDCGVRQPRETFVTSFEANQNSFGSYIFQNNYYNNTKPYLFPYGGGSINPILVAGIEMFGFLYPTVFIARNNTVALNGRKTSGSLITAPVLPDQPQLGPEYYKFGLFKRGGPRVFNAPKINGQKPTPNTWDAATIAGTGDVDPSPMAIMSGGGTIGFISQSSDPEQEPASFNDPLQFLVPRSAENVIYPFIIVNQDGGVPVGWRFRDAAPPQVLIKTLDPTLSNFSMFSFFQPQLYPYRVISIMNNQDTAAILANGGVIDATTDEGPGIHGIHSDIVACSGAKDMMEYAFSQCIVCNRGCPVQLPETCIVDPQNATFVPENPYYNTWLFSNIQNAVRLCKDPKRIIKVTRQNNPYGDSWELDYGNWTILSNGSMPAQILVSTPIIINADNITIHGFEFIHNAGDFAPTITHGDLSTYTAITFDNCTFNGENTQASALAGAFAGIAITKCTFNDYGSLGPVVDLNSVCGMLFFKKNVMNVVKRVALLASSFDVLVIEENDFVECGASATDAMPYCVYVSNCYDTASKIVFVENFHSATLYHYVAGTPRRAAYWIDGIPVFRLKGGALQIKRNTASGLDVGLRVTRVDDLSEVSYIGDFRATVAWLSIRSMNQAVTGLWHYIVWRQPGLEDAAIDADPDGTTKFYCDGDCSEGTGDASLIFLIGIVGMFLVFYCCWSSYRLPNPLANKYGVSEVTGETMALDYSVLPVKRYPKRRFFTSFWSS